MRLGRLLLTVAMGAGAAFTTGFNAGLDNGVFYAGYSFAR